MRDIQEFFRLGMDRELPRLLAPPMRPMGETLVSLNIGPGDVKRIPGTIGVGSGEDELTDVNWSAPKALPFHDDSVHEIHCYHFLEHLTGEDAIKVLAEFQRVLVPGGVVNVVTPYYNSNLQAHALDHKSAWCEDTWDWLFNQPYYNGGRRGSWRLEVNLCLIIGIVERNMALMTQLVKNNQSLAA